MVKGGYTPRFGVLGVHGNSLRTVPALAPNCPKFNYDALARHPQPMPSTHTVFFSGTVLAATQHWANPPPPYDYNLGEHIPQILAHLSTTPS